MVFMRDVYFHMTSLLAAACIAVLAHGCGHRDTIAVIASDHMVIRENQLWSIEKWQDRMLVAELIDELRGEGPLADASLIHELEPIRSAGPYRSTKVSLSSTGELLLFRHGKWRPWLKVPPPSSERTRRILLYLAVVGPANWDNGKVELLCL